MTTRARGTFEVTITPQPHVAEVGHPDIARMGLHKVFAGDIVGTATGQMLAVRTGVEGSAGYVAMDHVEATIAGRHGSFCLQHGGTMNRGDPTLSVTVVPDSGTGELSGISGSLSIDIRDGQHFYEFEYSLPAGG